jgi:hypothetical protein
MCDRKAANHGKIEKSTTEWLDMIKQAVNAGMFECSFTGGARTNQIKKERIFKGYSRSLQYTLQRKP